MEIESDPLFRHGPEELFQSGALAFAEATLSTSGFTFDYDINNATYPIDNIPVRDYLLAKAFPARTRPMGSTAMNPRVSAEWQKATYDMSDPTDGFKTSEQDWYRDNKYNGEQEWRHSDFRNAPYVHVYKLFEEITTKED